MHEIGKNVFVLWFSVALWGRTGFPLHRLAGCRRCIDGGCCRVWVGWDEYQEKKSFCDLPDVVVQRTERLAPGLLQYAPHQPGCLFVLLTDRKRPHTGSTSATTYTHPIPPPPISQTLLKTAGTESNFFPSKPEFFPPHLQPK